VHPPRQEQEGRGGVCRPHQEGDLEEEQAQDIQRRRDILRRFESNIAASLSSSTSLTNVMTVHLSNSTHRR
jgi:hypothetical protein